LGEGGAYGPNDCLLGEFQGQASRGLEYATLLSGMVRNTPTGLALVPSPKGDHAVAPERGGFPVRFRFGHDPVTEAEKEGTAALQHMNEVLARIQELEEALEDPAMLWERLREAWKRADDEANPSMAEIVRQARRMQPVFGGLEKRVRRVLRKHRELTPLDRVREMGQASMVWLSRQPGRNIPERAGASQRILATVRRENFDTLENRVLHAHARLAVDAARQWIREHPSAKSSARYDQVDAFLKSCRTLARTLANLGGAIAPAGITPNCFLMQDRSYREVHDCWLRLLLRRKVHCKQRHFGKRASISTRSTRKWTISSHPRSQRAGRGACRALDLHNEPQKRNEQQKSQDKIRAQIAAIVAGNPDLTIAARNFEKEHDGDLRGVLGVLMAAQGTQSSASGLYQFLTDMRMLDEEPTGSFDWMSATDRTDMRRYVSEITGRLAGPLPAPAGQPPGPWASKKMTSDFPDAVLALGLTAGEMLWHAAAIDPNVMKAADFSRAEDIGDPMAFALNAAEFMTAGAGWSLGG
jgi:hypothetical protein